MSALEPTLLIRYGRIARFETLDGNVRVDFPRYESEWESSQSLQNGITPISGADYGYDVHGTSAAVVNSAQETWRCMVPQSQVDNMRARVHSIGNGRLWAEYQSYAPDTENVYRWCRARISEIPGFTLTMPPLRLVPMVFAFTRLSDWYSADPSVAEETLTSSPSNMEIEIGGSMVSRNIVVTLTAHSAGGWDHPIIRNTNSAEQFTINRTAGNGDVARVDVLGFRLEHNGEDDTANLSLGGAQVMPLSLGPGVNVIQVTGAPDATVHIEAYTAWR